MALGTITLLTTLTLIFLAIGWLIGGFLGMGIALIIAIVINLLSYWYSDTIVLRMYKAQPSEDIQLNTLVKELAQEAKIHPPKVYTIPLDVPNAFATGRGGTHTAIAVTKGLTENLDKEEMEGVLAHEIGHIKNRDILVGTLAATIAGAISYLAQIGYFSLFFSGDRRGEGNLMGLILIIIFAPLAALLVRMAISRKREYRADYSGAILTKKPHALAAALRKIATAAHRHPVRGSSATAHIWIVSPFNHDWFTGLFMTHPPLEKRIERLENMARGEID
jgi:heat shock protein HtpX